MSNPAPEWSPEQVGALRTMAGEQRLSARKIARALTAQFGIIRSHNAVLAKLYRLSRRGRRCPPAQAPRSRGWQVAHAALNAACAASRVGACPAGG
jgi:hypothetical protein